MGSEGKEAQSSAAEIVFRGVTKRYPGRSAAAVDNLSLRIPAGEICVLVGPSGGGKTTAMKMVNRLIEITEGDILIDGRSVSSLEVIELRRRIGYVPQLHALFPFSLPEPWRPLFSIIAALSILFGNVFYAWQARRLAISPR